MKLEKMLLAILLAIALLAWFGSVVNMIETGRVSPLPFLPFVILISWWTIEWIRKRRGRRGKACLKQSSSQ